MFLFLYRTFSITFNSSPPPKDLAYSTVMENKIFIYRPVCIKVLNYTGNTLLCHIQNFIMMTMQLSHVEFFKLISLPITYVAFQTRSDICCLLYRTHSLATHYCQSETQVLLTSKHFKGNFTFCSNCLQIQSLLERRKTCFSFCGLFQSDMLTTALFFA